MEYYAPLHGGGGSSLEGDPSADWHIQHAVACDPADSGETGLEEGIWQLSLEAQYPERPGEPDCVYYMRTGLCSFGMSCRYHHPPNWRAAVARCKADYPERPSQPECQYYLKTGTCKFGATCKYHHPRDKAAGRVQLNVIGLPWRQGEKECAYYMRTGACKYGVTCKFHHPQPTPVAPPSPTATWPLKPPPLVHGPRLIIPPPQQGLVPMPGWTTYQGDPYGGGGGPNYFLDPYVAVPKDFPERPGQPECQYYLKTGDCKFGAACRYHHPKDKGSNLLLSSLGLPLRPGAPACTYYTRNGLCRFGAACRFDHPLLASSLAYSPPSAVDSIPMAPAYRTAAATGTTAATFPSSPLCEVVVVRNLSRHSSSSAGTVDSEELDARAATTPVSSTVQSSSISSDTTSC